MRPASVPEQQVGRRGHLRDHRSPRRRDSGARAARSRRGRTCACVCVSPDGFARQWKLCEVWRLQSGPHISFLPDANALKEGPSSQRRPSKSLRLTITTRATVLHRRPEQAAPSPKGPNRAFQRSGLVSAARAARRRWTSSRAECRRSRSVPRLGWSALSLVVIVRQKQPRVLGGTDALTSRRQRSVEQQRAELSDLDARLARAAKIEQDLRARLGEAA